MDIKNIMIYLNNWEYTSDTLKIKNYNKNTDEIHCVRDCKKQKQLYHFRQTKHVQMKGFWVQQKSM